MRTRESEGEGSSRGWGDRDRFIEEPGVGIVSPVARIRIPQCRALVVESLEIDILSPGQYHLEWVGGDGGSRDCEASEQRTGMVRREGNERAEGPTSVCPIDRVYIVDERNLEWPAERQRWSPPLPKNDQATTITVDALANSHQGLPRGGSGWGR